MLSSVMRSGRAWAVGRSGPASVVVGGAVGTRFARQHGVRRRLVGHEPAPSGKQRQHPRGGQGTHPTAPAAVQSGRPGRGSSQGDRTWSKSGSPAQLRCVRAEVGPLCPARAKSCRTRAKRRSPKKLAGEAAASTMKARFATYQGRSEPRRPVRHRETASCGACADITEALRGTPPEPRGSPG